jgi:hypothetical protein
VRGHGAGAGVGEQVDEHIVGVEQEQIVMRGAEQGFALSAGGPADGFNALDAEGLDDGFSRHARSSWIDGAWISQPSQESSIGVATRRPLATAAISGNCMRSSPTPMRVPVTWAPA